MSEQDLKKIFQRDEQAHLSLDKMVLYKEGKLSKDAALAVERLQTEDAFLAEALEYLDEVDAQQVASISAAVNQRIDGMVGQRKAGLAPLVRYAAAAAVVASLGTAGWLLFNQQGAPANQHQVAQTQQVIQNTPAAEKVKTEPVVALDPAMEAELDRYEAILQEEVNGLNKPEAPRQVAPEAVAQQDNTTPDAPIEEAAPVIAHVDDAPANDANPVIQVDQPKITPEIKTAGIGVAIVNVENPGAIGKYPGASKKLGKKVKHAAAYADKQEDKSNKYQYDPMYAAQFPGGQSGLATFLKNELKDQTNANGETIHGSVLVKFEVSSKGKVSKVSAAESTDQKLSAEAVRAVKAMPSWQAAQEGKEKVFYTLSVRF